MRKENLAGTGTIIAALLAASCCIGPAVFVVFGVSVGFLGKLAFLDPYSPHLTGVAVLLLGYSFFRLYLRPVECKCQEDFRARRISRVIFWIGIVSLVFALAFQRVLLALAS